jgi:ketosteroid isomerase-like protein
MTARSVVGVISLGLLVAGGVPFDRTSALIEAAPPPSCPSGLNERTPQQVLADFRAALAAGDWAAVRCNFDDDAVMISDNGITNGPAEIVTEFQAFFTFFGGFFDQVYSEIVVNVLGGNRYMARVLYTVDTVCSDVPDGAYTYVIKGGRIAALTTHGFIQFSC